MSDSPRPVVPCKSRQRQPNGGPGSGGTALTRDCRSTGKRKRGHHREDKLAQQEGHKEGVWIHDMSQSERRLKSCSTSNTSISRANQPLRESSNQDTTSTNATTVRRSAIKPTCAPNSKLAQSAPTRGTTTSTAGPPSRGVYHAADLTNRIAETAESYSLVGLEWPKDYWNWFVVTLGEVRDEVLDWDWDRRKVKEGQHVDLEPSSILSRH